MHNNPFYVTSEDVHVREPRPVFFSFQWSEVLEGWRFANSHSKTRTDQLNNTVNVVAVTTDGPGSLCVEHKDAQDAIETFLDSTTWEVIKTTDLAGQYPRAYIGPLTEHCGGSR